LWRHVEAMETPGLAHEVGEGRNFWIEKTIVSGRPDRESGDDAVGKDARKTPSARGGPNGHRVHVSDRLGLRDKAEQVRSDPRSVTRDERRVSELVDQKRVVEVTGIAPIPEFRQVFENLIVVLLGADRNFR